MKIFYGFPYFFIAKLMEQRKKLQNSFTVIAVMIKVACSGAYRVEIS